MSNIESSYTNVTSLFAKLCDVTKFTKEIKGKLDNITEVATSTQFKLCTPYEDQIPIRFADRVIIRGSKDSIYTYRHLEHDPSYHGYNKEAHFLFKNIDPCQ